MAIKSYHITLILAVLLILREVDALKCYACHSQDSLDDCMSKQKEKSCPSYSPDCVTGVQTCYAGEVMEKVYYKGCGATSEGCEISSKEEPSCSNSQSWSKFSTSETCCTGDNCNHGPSPKNSGSLRYTSVILPVYLFLAAWEIVFMS